MPVKPNMMPFKSDEFRPHYESPITTTYKWSTIERMFRTPDNERIFAAQPPARDTPNDYAPMYSCFNPKGVFNPAKLKRRAEMTPDQTKAKSETKATSGYSPNVTRRTLNATNNEGLLGGVTVGGLGGAGTQSVFSRIGFPKKNDPNVTSASGLKEGRVGIRSGGFNTITF